MILGLVLRLYLLFLQHLLFPSYFHLSIRPYSGCFSGWSRREGGGGAELPQQQVEDGDGLLWQPGHVGQLIRNDPLVFSGHHVFFIVAFNCVWIHWRSFFFPPSQMFDFITSTISTCPSLFVFFSFLIKIMSRFIMMIVSTLWIYLFYIFIFLWIKYDVGVCWHY